MGKKSRISQYKTQLDSVAFISLLTVADCVLCCEILFFLGINNRPANINFPTKMNSGKQPTNQNLQNQDVVVWVLQNNRDKYVDKFQYN